MAKNANLTAAKKAKNDEFYTQITDIEKELVHYHDQLRGKIVFCNCDDPTYSNFWRYFHLNFAKIGLKKLVSTHFDPEKPTYKLEYEGGNDEDWSVGRLTVLSENGDFRSPECIELLKSCDVVVTNPPFSLFREYVAQLMQYGKKFIIIGNMNAITYKEIFPLLKDNQLWTGYKCYGGGMNMLFSPEKFDPAKVKKYEVRDDGWYIINIMGVIWYTNIDIAKRHEPLTLFRRYADDPSKYPKYDNYDAINVDKVTDIPEDYFEHIGVPITYLDKYCPEQFEIIGATESEGKGFGNGLYLTDRQTDRQADGQRQESLQKAVYPEKIRIYVQPDGSGRIWPCAGVDLRRLAEKYESDGFWYCSGVMGVPITFLDKYCPEQFEIVAFRKGNDGKDLVFTRERERVQPYFRILVRRRFRE